MTADPAIVPFGDSALLVSLGERIDLESNRKVHALAAEVASLRRSDGRWGVPVPGYASLLVPYDPDALTLDEATERLGAVVARSAQGEGDDEQEGPLVEIPVRYGGDEGPDLAEVAERRSLTPAQVVELHSATEYRVFILGFAPGFAYLGLLPAEIVVPRRATPRPRVPAGSVAIAGEQTAVYPLATPGGWNLIGRTELSVWDPGRDPPALLAPGAMVRFRPVPG